MESELEYKLFKCPFCYMKYKTITGLKEHIGKSHSNGIITCPICKYMFTSYLSFQKHLHFSNDELHQNLLYLFKKGQHKFLKKDLFIFDEETNMSKFEFLINYVYYFKCPFCDYKVNILSKLKLHIFAHHYDKELICPYCNAKFENLNDLIDHLEYYRDDKHRNLYYLLTNKFEKINDVKQFLMS